MRRLGVLMGHTESDPEAQLRIAAFKLRLAELGWVDGRNLKIDMRWIEAKSERAAEFAKELVAMRPDVILTSTTMSTAAAQRQTQSIPIVFTVVADPIGSGFVQSLARPGGNITGFVNFESSLIEKWLQLLKAIAPRTTNVAVMFNPDTTPYVEYYLGKARAVAPELGTKVSTAPVRNDEEIQKAIAKLGRTPGSGLLVMTDIFMTVHRRTVIAAASRSKVPSMYFAEYMVADGGLIGYGIDYIDMFRRAASHVDRILRGAKPADLSVELPAKFDLALNMNTAKALGLKIPPSIRMQATKIIE